MDARGRVLVVWDDEHQFADIRFENVLLKDEADVAWLRQELVEQYERLARPFDCLICLDGLHLERGAVRAFGEMRASLTNEYCRTSRRYGGERAVQTAVLTSGVLYDAGRDMFPTREHAVRDLIANRGSR